MKTTVLCVGKIKEKYLTAAVEEYVKRLSRYTKVEIVEVADERTAEGASKKEEDQVRRTEGCRLLSRIPDGAYVIALGAAGRTSWSAHHGGRKQPGIYHRRVAWPVA